MSDTGEGNPAPGGQENPVDDVGAWVWEVGAEDAVICDSEPRGNEEAEAEAEAEGGMVGVPGAAGSLSEEAMEVGVPEGGISGEDSNMGSADEGQQLPNPAVDAAELPVADFRFVFLDLVRTMLHHLYYSNHIFVPPRRRLRRAQSRSQMPIRLGRIRMFSGEGVISIIPQSSGEGAAAMGLEGPGEGAAAMGLEDPGEGPAAMVPWGLGEGAAAMVLEGPGEGAAAMVPWGLGEGAREGAAAMMPWGLGEGAAPMALEGPGEGAAALALEGPGEGAAAPAPEDQPEADVEEPAQKAGGPEETTKYQCEKTEEEAQDSETKEEKEELNENKKDPKRM